MASSNERTPIRTGSIGRGFASMDPERQPEIPGNTIRTSQLRAPARAAHPAGGNWMRTQPERTVAMFEGSSSRRSR
jgi:hypothetical protein